jgi:hypothetical protein
MCITAIIIAVDRTHDGFWFSATTSCHAIPPSDDPYRYGAELKVAANLFKILTTQEIESYTLPYGLLDIEARKYHETYSLSHRIPIYQRPILLSTALDLQDVISENKCAIIFLFADLDDVYWDLLSDLDSWTLAGQSYRLIPVAENLAQ